MVTGFDILGHDKRLQRHWLYRCIAIVIDGLVVFGTLGFILWFVGINKVIEVGLITSIVFFLYSALLESTTGVTIGKKAVGLKVRPLISKNIGGRIVVRNVPKIFWFILLPLDLVLGLATRGDPRQRMFDRLVKTTVVQVKEPDFHIHVSKGEEEIRQIPEIEEKAEVTAPEEQCTSCGGKLIQIPEDKFQCKQCGEIQ